MGRTRKMHGEISEYIGFVGKPEVRPRPRHQLEDDIGVYSFGRILGPLACFASKEMVIGSKIK